MPGPLPARELRHLEAELEALRAENVRLRRLLDAQDTTAARARAADRRAARVRAMLHDSGSRNP